MRDRAFLLAVLCLAVVSCSKGEEPRMQNADTLTQRQHDSVIGASKLPGASGVSKAQGAQDAAAARTAATDSAARADSL